MELLSVTIARGTGIVSFKVNKRKKFQNSKETANFIISNLETEVFNYGMGL